MNAQTASADHNMSERRRAVLIGTLFILATALGVANVGLVLGPVLTGPDIAPRLAENTGALRVGSVLNIAMTVAIAAIAVAFYPVIRHRHPILAPAYLVARLAEAIVIAVAGMFWVVVAQTVAIAADSAPVLLEMATSLFNLGAQVVFGITALILNTILLKTPLVPRWLALWGLIGGAMILILGVVQMLGYPIARIEAVMTAPIALNEMVLALWLIIKGFAPLQAR